MTDKLIFKKGGDILRISGKWDEEEEKWNKVEEILDFIPTAWERHDISLELEEGLTLRDVFLYVNKHLDIWTLLLGNWCREYVIAGLTREKEEEKDKDLVIEYLRVYTHNEITKYKDGEITMDRTDRLDFDGRGYHKNPNTEIGETEGEINIGVGFTPTQNLLDYPIKIDRTHELWYDDHSVKYECKDGDWTNPKKLFEFEDLSVSLFQFLYAIFWELSFHGGPEDTKKVKDDLNATVERIKNGEEKLIPADEVFKELEERLEAKKCQEEMEKTG